MLCEYGCGKEAKHTFKNGKHCCSNTVFGCKKLSKKVRSKKLYKRRKIRSIKQWYNSPIAGLVHLDSSWEVAYAKYLDENNIRWIRNEIMFPYPWGKRKRYYIPDFYLIDEQLYVEIKGLKTDKDTAKWANFPSYYKLKTLEKEELEKVLGRKL